MTSEMTHLTLFFLAHICTLHMHVRLLSQYRSDDNAKSPLFAQIEPKIGVNFCDDNNACTSLDICGADGQCKGFGQRFCSGCTTCEPATGSCVDTCATGQTCHFHRCVGQPTSPVCGVKTCDMHGVCTWSGCSACEDCVDHACVPHCPTGQVCDTDADACVPEPECQYTSECPFPDCQTCSSEGTCDGAHRTPQHSTWYYRPCTPTK